MGGRGAIWGRRGDSRQRDRSPQLTSRPFQSEFSTLTRSCGTDVSFYTRGGIGSRVVQEPLVLGHEGAGIIHAVGSNVTRVKVGDHVAIEPALPCRVCRFCRSGQWNYCESDSYFATPGTGESASVGTRGEILGGVTVGRVGNVNRLSAGGYACRDAFPCSHIP